ncbi:hypothetical protein KSP40_PGU016197 [Platanthera guangdongensis]|uniref:Uncharacterized protein n=1 Tax=Platanthera guangdongensis TaxID=2320717 RepID=A0ABR2MTH3_9ASPA
MGGTPCGKGVSVFTKEELHEATGDEMHEGTAPRVHWGKRSYDSLFMRESKGGRAKTAALTLVLVAVLIVSLASVDSFLFYVLALLSRRSA